MATASFYSSSADSPDCAPCNLLGKSNEAKWHCGTCREYTCDDCHGVHSRLRMSKDHVTDALVQDTLQGQGVPSPISHAMVSSASIMTLFDASLEDDDKPCSITGSLVLGNIILLADADNNKIKLFNKEHFNLIFQMHVEKVYDMTNTSGDTIAVSNGPTHFFTLFSLNDNVLTEILKVQTHGLCWGISHHNGLIYVVCREEHICIAKVDVFTLDGTLKRRLEPLNQGQRVLPHPNYITINHQTGTLYVGDRQTNAVVGLSLSGKVLSNQTVGAREDMFDVSGLAVDDQGQLYVACFKSRVVMRMSPDGKPPEALVDKDICLPQCLHVHNNVMVLACRNTNIVKIYKLS